MKAMSPAGHGSKPLSSSDFRSLFDLKPARHTQQDLIALAKLMIQPADPADPKDGADDEENPYTPAGYTYLGQFVDHDLTFDTQSDLADLNSFQLASNDRTPRFDLDNVYGTGPSDQPYLYSHAQDGSADGKILLGDPLNSGVRDVQRNAEGRAIIGDPRNDENSIVVQLQSVFIRFHNALVNLAVAGKGVPKRTGSDAFSWAQKEARNHYQRLLLDDFLPRIIDTNAETVKPLFAALASHTKPKLRIFRLHEGPFMPLEFAVAAYRLGHSMIRPGYRLAESEGKELIFSIFAGQTEGLRGFQRLDKKRGIDWTLFFHDTLPAGQPLDDAGRKANNAKNGGDGTQFPHKRVQFAYKIDTMLVDPIAHLPDVVAPGLLPDDPDPQILRSLAVRNLLRGRDFGLPSGEAVADLLGVPKLDSSQLLTRGSDFDPKNRIRIAEKIPALAGNTPLWFYILAEAEQSVIRTIAGAPKTDPQSLGARLGPVGGAIVAETFVGLMMLDSDSVLNTSAQWRSINGNPTFTMIELLKFIGAIPK
jgi:hypothetical protein